MLLTLRGRRTAVRRLREDLHSEASVHLLSGTDGSEARTDLQGHAGSNNKHGTVCQARVALGALASSLTAAQAGDAV